MKNLLIACLCIAAIYLNSCGPSSRVSSAEFGKYVSGFTSGKVDMDAEIKIELTAAVLDSMSAEKRDSSFLKDHISISPDVDGNFYWVDYRTIGFKPEKQFQQGRHYHVRFKLGKFINTPVKFRTFEFNFETDEKKMDISEPGLQVNNPYVAEWQNYTLIATSNFELDPKEIQKCFHATEGDKSLPVTCVQIEPKRYKIIVDSIERKNKEEKLHLEWNCKSLGLKNKEEKTISVPSLGNFKVLSMEVKDDGDQQLDITFSDAIQPSQKLDGIIEIEDASNLKFNITGNVVSVFLNERIEGTKNVTVNKGILNYKNYKMDSTNTGIVEFEGVKPALRRQNKGCILPNSQGLLYPFESIGIHTVDVRIIKIRENNVHQFLQVNELDGDDGLTRVGRIVVEKKINIIADTVNPQNQWTTHILDLGKLIQPEPGALYRVCIRFKKDYTYLDCRNDNNNDDNNENYMYESEDTEDSTWNEYGWHGNGFDGYDTWRWNEDEDPCENSYYNGGAICSNILASDIGVIYQEEKDKTARIVTTNLLNAAALPNTEISLYSYTQEKIAAGTTDANGFLRLSPNQKPFLLVAKKGKQRAYLKLTNSNTLSLSKFDIEGTDRGDGLKGFLYAERGVWRPGDSVFLHFVLNDKSNPLPAAHPVKFELSDPDGKTIFSRTTTENTGHIYPLYFKTADNARMGSYTATVTVGNARFSQDILLEYIVPNRMKLESNVDGKLLTQKDSTVQLKVMWLNGATGKGLKTQCAASLRPNWNYFTKFSDYQFIAPYNKDYRGNFELPEVITNDSGIARYNIPGVTTADAPGIMSASYVFKAFEQGGGFSIDKSVSNISVFDSYVGLKSPDGGSYYGSLDYTKSYAFPYVIVNKDQVLVAGHHLHLKIYEMQRSNWYEADEDDIATFKSYSGKICVKDTQWVAAKGDGNFKFGNIGKPYGRYMIVLKDLASGHESGMIVVFDNPYWERYSSDDADYETIVQLSSSKKVYTVGEHIKLSVPAPENANILINIESDSKIIKQFWVKGNKKNEPIDIETNATMAPGVYVHATVLQPHHYTKDGSPIRQYGIIPLKIENPETKLLPVIKMNDEIRPETPANIQVSETSGKEMNYSLVLVDEGLLDLTHYRLPDIWEFMNSQQSLKIKTWDMYDQVIGAYAGVIQNVFTIGGDGSYDESEDSKANRFKPAIINLGVFHLKAGEKKTHTFVIPNYCGRMKAFVIAYSNYNSGSAEKEFYVKKPLMLLTSAPRMMSAKENYMLPVTVFNLDKKAKKVKVTCRIEGLQGYKFNQEQNIAFNDEGDAVVNFNLQLPEAVGILNMELTATDGKEVTKEKIEIQVKPTQPVINHQKTFEVNAGSSITIDAGVKGMKGTYNSTLDVNDKMNFDFQNRLNYLIQYPHGCVEQTTSSAFAQLFLNDVQDVNDDEAKEIKDHVDIVLKKLHQFQTYNGGFAYWPYQYEVNDFASVYVLHFMTEARDKGFVVSDYIWKNALNYQKEAAKHHENSFTANSYTYWDKELTQAYRLYLLARLNQADITSMNKMQGEVLQSNTSKAFLAKAYSLIGKNDVAKNLLLTFKAKSNNSLDYSNTFGSDLRDESMSLIALNNMGSKSYCQNLANDISRLLSNNYWNSTISTSLALTALSKYYSLDKQGIHNYSLNGKAYSFSKHTQTVKLSTVAAYGNIIFKNSSAQKMYLTLNERYSDNNFIAPLINRGMKLNISYWDMNNHSLKEWSLQHGTNFMAKIEVSNTTDISMQNVALEFGIANGWQIISNRYMDDETINKNSSCDYKDAKDDGVYYYFNLTPKETKTFYVLLNASYKGTFYLPLAQCYPMYNEGYKAQQAGKWVKVGD
ncbi:hypothetical protein F0919_03295 [Taibaiella lutea]|uniref:Alpha-2-macroglobulin domain-containing protein n=1 Tax=Taibaiella lutea TaxID=2608001 RepID=A0A5M6CU50_9BACT|nr:MG2 domain-containing protein [Taibaiella lutea]KAA5536709.1 hypothetical protein F0919_03295 [Taibaiella lutea]